MSKVLLVIPVSAILIAGLVTYKLSRPQAPSMVFPAAGADVVRPAPLFRLNDEHMQLVRLERTFGRKKMLIAFFDSKYGQQRSDLLEALRRDFPKLHDAGATILAISATPRLNQRMGLERDGPFPFPLLSDLDYQVHQQWGAWNAITSSPREAVFIVDRAGLIRHMHLGPEGLGAAEEWADELRHVR